MKLEFAVLKNKLGLKSLPANCWPRDGNKDKLFYDFDFCKLWLFGFFGIFLGLFWGFLGMFFYSFFGKFWIKKS
jgi:hypothetical protein